MIRDLDQFIDGMRPVLDALAAEVWVKDAGFLFRFANRRFARSVGSDPLDLLGVDERPFFERRDVHMFRDTDRAAFKRGEAIIVPERLRSTPHRLFDTIKIPLLGPRRKPAGSIGIAINTARWRQVDAYGALQQSSTVEASSSRWLAESVGMRQQILRGLAIGEVAARIGVHPDTLGRRFREQFGLRPVEYRHWLRARQALALVIDGELTLAGIGAECGYTDQSHFTRSFKRVFGATPGSLRRMCRHAN